MSFAPIDVSILTGFLGSGKTTLLNRLLKDPALTDTAVIINEFGDISIDHLLVEQASDGVIELSDGCLCCTVRGELVDTLADLIDRVQTGSISKLRRIVIETTGLADPAPVLQAIMGHPVLLQALRLDGVITTVDAVNAMATLDQHLEAVKQIAVADRIVLTKAELVSPSERDVVLQRIRNLNPAAEIFDVTEINVGYAALFECGLYNPQTKTADVARWLKSDAYSDTHTSGSTCHDHSTGTCNNPDHHHHHHDDAIQSYSLQHDAPISYSVIEMFLDLLRSTHGDKLLRMKGIICIAEHPERPLVLHGVQKILHPPVRLPMWPETAEKYQTRLVIITKDLSENYVRDLFNAFLGRPQIDQPDREAMIANPLAIPGFTVGK